mmetsp:Transcript_971/g.936  ORF Transcript_971/g.936 Transcript_971/m.936 type:complete len:220 (-) Transcript_971:379-1038(-)
MLFFGAEVNIAIFVGSQVRPEPRIGWCDLLLQFRRKMVEINREFRESILLCKILRSWLDLPKQYLLISLKIRGRDGLIPVASHRVGFLAVTVKNMAFHEEVVFIRPAFGMVLQNALHAGLRTDRLGVSGQVQVQRAEYNVPCDGLRSRPDVMFVADDIVSFAERRELQTVPAELALHLRMRPHFVAFAVGVTRGDRRVVAHLLRAELEVLCDVLKGLSE